MGSNRAAEETTRALWVGFGVAYALVGGLLVAGVVATHLVMGGQGHDGEAMDRAGLQRMLGQVVARHVLAAKLGDEDGFSRLETERALRDIEQHSERLRSPELGLDAAALAELDGVEQRTRALREVARAAFEGTEGGSVARLNAAIGAHEEATDGLVRLLARRSSERYGRLAGVEVGLCAAIGLVLLTTLAGIVRPLARRVRTAIDREKRARAVTEAALKARHRFVMNMSHELRTPLNGILGKLVLLRSSHLDEEQLRHATDLQRSADRLSGLVDDVLDLQSPDLQRQDSEVDLIAVAEECIRKVVPLARQKGLRMELAIDPVLDGTVMGDRSRLVTALDHLMGNAVGFTDFGHVQLSVERLEGDLVRFLVVDSGVGVSPLQESRLFEAFAIGDESSARSHQGAGLGLAVTRRLARLMGGEVGYERDSPRGSRFWFTARMAPAVSVRRLLDEPGAAVVLDGPPVHTQGLVRWLETWGAKVYRADGPEEVPRLAAWAHSSGIPVRSVFVAGTEDESELAKAGDLPRIRIPTADATGHGDLALWTRDGLFHRLSEGVTEPEPMLKVLVVDDNPINLEVTAATLEGFGCEVEIAENGAEALGRITEHPGRYNLVLMDWHMPVMDGVEATKRIRSSPQSALLPVIALTAGSVDEARPPCLGAGMNEVLSKPIDLGRLERVLDGVRTGAFVPQPP